MRTPDRSCIVAVLTGVLILARPAAAADPAAQATLDAATQSLSDAVRSAILENLDGAYEDSENWGRTTRVLAGFKLDSKGFKSKIIKRYREANDGLWQKYRVTLIDPQQRLQVRLADVRTIGPGHFAFQLTVAAPLHGDARVERWRKGIKMLNFHAEADSTIEARLDCDVQLQLVEGKYLRDLVVQPTLTNVDLRLVDLDLHRISKLGGDVARELGNSLKGLIGKELRRRAPKIKDKLNAAIAKNQDKLRISPDKLLTSSWSHKLVELGSAAHSAASLLGSSGTPRVPLASDDKASQEGSASEPAPNATTTATIAEEQPLPLVPVRLRKPVGVEPIDHAAPVTRPAIFEEEQPPLVPIRK